MYGQNRLIAFLLDETGKVPKMGKILQWPVENPQQHFEDPRGVLSFTVFNKRLSELVHSCGTGREIGQGRSKSWERLITIGTVKRWITPRSGRTPVKWRRSNHHTKRTGFGGYTKIGCISCTKPIRGRFISLTDVGVNGRITK
jgi:hypothetical protein